jgi:hypothetical protein
VTGKNRLANSHCQEPLTPASVFALLCDMATNTVSTPSGVWRQTGDYVSTALQANSEAIMHLRETQQESANYSQFEVETRICLRSNTSQTLQISWLRPISWHGPSSCKNPPPSPAPTFAISLNVFTYSTFFLLWSIQIPD